MPKMKERTLQFFYTFEGKKIDNKWENFFSTKFSHHKHSQFVGKHVPSRSFYWSSLPARHFK